MVINLKSDKFCHPPSVKIVSLATNPVQADKPKNLVTFLAQIQIWEKTVGV